MDIEEYIIDRIFSEQEKQRCFYELIWEKFKEDGFVITDEEDHEIDCIFKAVALQNLAGEFAYRLYDEVNEIGLEDVIENLQNLGYDEDDVFEYCKANEEVSTAENDFELTVKNALDYTSKISANKMLEDMSADDIFDYMFTATYDFQQDFTFDFEDADEFQAFVDSNTEQLDDYKMEYPSLLTWIENGMIC